MSPGSPSSQRSVSFQDNTHAGGPKDEDEEVVGVTVALPSSSNLSRPPTITSTLICPNCGGSGNDCIEHHEASGASICTNCGIVVEENAIVSSVEFVEGAGGSSSMVGQFVSATSSKAYTGGSGAGGRARYGFARDSRETTLANGRRRLQEVASRLRLGPLFVDAAHRLYTLAVEHNFVQGRKSSHVVAACLYMACRQEQSQHMLIDFSDAVQVNVYSLGTCFLKFRRLLGLKLAIIDPALYIYRFAAHLDLADDANAVALTALRLVARMKRDWIVQGRRPAGICAAALLLAARAHGFARPQQDVTHILRVCGLTVRKRLREFEATPSSRLSLEQFHTVDLQAEADPPRFTQNKLLEARARAIEAGHVSLLESGALDDPMQKGKHAMQWRKQTLHKKDHELQRLYSSLETEIVAGAKEEREEMDLSELEGNDEGVEREANTTEVMAENQSEAPAAVSLLESNGHTNSAVGVDKVAAVGETDNKMQDKNSPAKASKTVTFNPSVEVNTAKGATSVTTEVPLDLSRAYPKTSFGKSIVLPDYSTPEERIPSSTPVEAKLDMAEWKKGLPESINDEVDSLFRTDQEQRQMEVIFNKINKDYIILQERKESARLSEEAQQVAGGGEDGDSVSAAVKGDSTPSDGAAGPRKYKKRKLLDANATTEEQLMAHMSSRKMSRKINYDALSSIFDDKGTFSTEVVKDDGFANPEQGMYEFL